jgi:hypothetical protein
MINRKLTPTGDYTFGKGAGNFLVNSPAAVAQAVQTLFGLVRGEWFLDILAGVPYNTKILGAGTKGTYDAAIQSAILSVQGVLGIASYSSSIDPNTRKATVVCTIDTIYGSAAFTSTQKPFNYAPALLDTTFVLNSSTLL